MKMIVACGKNFEIGNKNDMPWGRTMKDDLKFFQKTTLNEIVIMGRKTFESIGKPLENRINVILTKDKFYKKDGCIVINEIDEIKDLKEEYLDKKIYIIGGSQIYKLFLNEGLIEEIILTKIDESFEADTFIEKLEEKYTKKELIQKIEKNKENKYSAEIYSLKKE